MKKWIHRTAAVFLAVMIFSGMLFYVAGLKADAAGKSEYDKDDFTIETELAVSGDGETYDFHIEIANAGPDFEGTVRVIAENGYSETCAYDTAISLSEGSTKQFTVRIPCNTIDIQSVVDPEVDVILLDNKENEVAKKRYHKLFDSYADKVLIGVLSNAYSDLSYLDLFGDSIYLCNDYYFLELVELTEDTVAEKLSELDYLVIDQYDTSILSAASVDAVEKWVDQGGMLIFGTGSSGYEVLSGFDPSFLQTECLGIYSPETGFSSEQKGEMYTITGARDPYDYYGVTIDMYLPMDSYTYNNQNTMHDEVYVDTAILSQFSQYDGNYHYGQGYASSVVQGNGSITYLYYSLSDPLIVGVCADYSNSYVTENILDMALNSTLIDYSAFHQNLEKGFRYYSYADEALGMIDMENSDLNYGILKAIIIFYVLLVGPLIYLVLKALKKRELYWVAVPVLALLFVGIISFAGRGFRIADITVCSVTCVDAGGEGETGSVLYAYSASHDDWQMKLSDNCAYAGPATSNFYNYAGSLPDYYHRVVNDISGISCGIRPTSSFETAMFQCRAAEPTQGELLMENIDVWSSVMQGEVTNLTGYDFTYMAVCQDGEVYIINGVKNGETVELDRADVEISISNISSMDEIFWRTAENYYSDDKEAAAHLAALYIGITQAGNIQDTVVVGVTPNYIRVTDGDYKETSFGCFYCRET